MKFSTQHLTMIAICLLAPIALHASSLTIAETTGEPGQTVFVPIDMDAWGDVAGVHMRMRYDTEKIEFLGIEMGPVAGAEHRMEFSQPETGTLNFVLRPSLGAAALSRSAGMIALMSFRIDPAAADGDVAHIDLLDTRWGPPVLPPTGISDIWGNPMDHVVTVGKIRVLEEGAVLIDELSDEKAVADILLPEKAVYADRGYVFRAPLPERLHGQTYLRTRNDDQDIVSSDYLGFSVSQPVRVYVALDSRIGSPPAWLSAWTELNQHLFTSDTWDMRRLYSRDFPAGTISLGSNRDESMPVGMSMYSVIITPQWPNQAGTWMCYE